MSCQLTLTHPHLTPSRISLAPRNFWEELLDGHLMPSFDPCRSQTNDVVRQAIIPSSRVGDRGRALAELWEERPVLPQLGLLIPGAALGGYFCPKK